MKFNPEDWSETHAKEWHEGRKGWLRVRCAEPCALYIASEAGVEALFGVGTSFDVETTQEVMWRVYAVSGDADARVFVYSPPSTSFEAAGESFTNIDRMVSESGNLLEVKKAMRAFQLEQRALLGQIRAERDSLLAEKAKPADKADDKPEADDKPADKADDKPKADDKEANE